MRFIPKLSRKPRTVRNFRVSRWERESLIDRSIEWEGRKMSRNSISMKLVCSVGLVGLLTVAPGARTGSAQGMNDMVRTLNNIVNPSDAQRLEDQARRNGRVPEERYWRDYRAGPRAIPETAVTGAPIPIKEIIPMIGAEKVAGDDTGKVGFIPTKH